MTISVYQCLGHVYFVRCAPVGSMARTLGYRAEAYRVAAGRKLQQVLGADGCPLHVDAPTSDDAQQRLLEHVEACLGARAEHLPAFACDGYVLHGTCELSHPQTPVGPR